MSFHFVALAVFRIRDFVLLWVTFATQLLIVIKPEVEKAHRWRRLAFLSGNAYHPSARMLTRETKISKNAISTIE